MKLDASKYEGILKSSPEMESFIKHNLEAMEKSMGKVNIIRDFQACLNEAIKVGRKPRGKPYIYTEGRRLEHVLAKVCFKLDKESGHLYAITNILFDVDSGFLDMIEWETKIGKVNQGHIYTLENLYDQRPPGGSQTSQGRYDNSFIEYHKMRLSILKSDELRMKRVLDNMKGFITKK